MPKTTKISALEAFYVGAYGLAAYALSFSILRLASFRASSPAMGAALEALFPCVQCFVVFMVGCFYCELWKQVERPRIGYLALRFLVVPSSCVLALPAGTVAALMSGNVRVEGLSVVLFLLSVDLLGKVGPWLLSEVKRKYPGDFDSLENGNTKAREMQAATMDMVMGLGLLVLVFL